MLKIIEPYPYEYLILGQHYLTNEQSESHIARLANDYASLVLYVNECIEALTTGKFFYFAHPDIVNFKGDPRLYRAEMIRLCKAAKSMNIPLEINLLGLREGREYPRIDFWQIASEIGNDVILGSDSHEPGVTAREKDIRAAMEIVNGFGLHLIEPMEPKIIK
jgi:histidinol-phosphatase (PHP family)